MTAMPNLAGFGVATWKPRSARTAEPFVYRSTTRPVLHRDLRSLQGKLEPGCVPAHVRGGRLSGPEVVGDSDLHPLTADASPRSRCRNTLF
jgi:hypothetical protein